MKGLLIGVLHDTFRCKDISCTLPLLHVLLGVIQSVDKTSRFNLNDASKDFARSRKRTISGNNYFQQLRKVYLLLFSTQ